VLGSAGENRLVKTISSPENPLIKTVLRLQRRTGRRAKGRFLLEGVKLAEEALASQIEIERALVSTRFAESEAGAALIARLVESKVPWVAVRERLFRRASSLESPEGILLIARAATHPLASLAGELVVVLVGIQDPSNLGAMARVAEAAGASGLVKCRGSADPFQPKALRASMGSLARLPVFEGDEPESTLAALKERGFLLAACLPRGGADFRQVDFRTPLALVVGNESMGLPDRLLELSDIRVSVPMKDTVESLNVAVVTGLVLYEAARQRGKS
jgi:TrmH family RNA methyltransferase